VSKLVLMLLLVPTFALAQETSKLPDAPPAHHFLDKQNVANFSVLAGLAAIDSVTTQHILSAHRGRELDPLVRALVTRGWKGQMAATTLGYSAVLTTAYAFHKTGHHRWERWSIRLAILTEVASVSNNIALNAHERGPGAAIPGHAR
jgi:hypothetical protein